MGAKPHPESEARRNYANGTVTDTSTGLMWDQCSWGQTNDSVCTGTASPHDWLAAFGVAAMANGSAWKGYSDWRLPSIVDLMSLVKGTTGPTIDATAFPNTPASLFWSASAYAGNPGYAWLVFFNAGYANYYYKYGANQVRLVRAGQYFGSFGLFPVGVSAVTANSATLSATSAVTATGSWLVVPRNATPPSAEQVIAGTNYSDVTKTANGSDLMTAKTPANFAVNSLAAGTTYDVYVVAKDTTYQTNSNVAGPIPFSTKATTTRSIVIDPATPANVYAALDGSGVYRSTNSGANWSPATTQPVNLNVKALVIKPGTAATLFAASYGGGVFKSTDSGVNWNVACATQPSNLNLLSLSIDAAGRLYAGSEAGVFVSSNDCGTWTAMNTGLPN